MIPADPAWVQQTLTYALNTLDANSPPDPAASSDNSQSSARGSQTALRTLRYLETPQLSTPWFVLSAAANPRLTPVGLKPPHWRATVIKLLSYASSSSKCPHQTWSSLTTTYPPCQLQLDLENSPLPSRADNDSEQKKIIAARSKRYFELTDALYQQTADLLPTKQGRARAESLYTLLVRDNDFTSKIPSSFRIRRADTR